MTGSFVYMSPATKNITPNIPISEPTNSIVSTNSTLVGAHKNAINTPTTIIGIPTPAVICLDAMQVCFFVKSI